MPSRGNTLGLVLTAGGARGAYQAGVLKRIGEIPLFRDKPSPFRVIAGASAGAINGTAMAAGTENLYESTQLLSQLWAELRVQDVYRSDTVALGSIAAGWIRDLSFGGIFGGGRAQSLLDTSPLRGFLSKHLRFDKIQDAIDRNLLYAVAISATNYYSGKSYTFIQGQKGHPLWTKSRRLSYSVQLNVDHVCASSAIPIVFSPVLVRADFGDYYYGDGALRLVNPCSPVIRLGANKLLAIGIRSQRAAEEASRATLLETEAESNKETPVMKRPPLAQVIGVLLNSIFLDHLDADLDHLIRMNDIISQSRQSEALVSAGNLDSRSGEPLPPGEPDPRHRSTESMKVVTPMVITPSVDIGKVAESYASKMPGTIRYMLEGLGNSRAESADLISYLLFDTAYTKTLIDIGYRDASARIDELTNFLT